MASFYGSGKRDVFLGLNKDDAIYGKGNNDHLSGSEGNDRIYGGNDEDKLDGGAGNDQLYGEHGRDFLIGGTGNDLLDGGVGNDYLIDFSGSDLMRGGEGNDRVVSERHAHTSGGVGNDHMVMSLNGLVDAPGTGAIGGYSGFDTFVLNVEKASIKDEKGAIVKDPMSYVAVTGYEGDGFYGDAGVQNDVINRDQWTRVKGIDFSGMNAIEASDQSALYFEGRFGGAVPASSKLWINGSEQSDFFQLGGDNEVIRTGEGRDKIYTTGLLPAPSNTLDLGTDHITDFNATQGDVLLVGWGLTSDSRVEIAEAGGKTIVKSYAVGQESPLNTVILDVVGVQDSIITGWDAII